MQPKCPRSPQLKFLGNLSQTSNIVSNLVNSIHMTAEETLWGVQKPKAS